MFQSDILRCQQHTYLSRRHESCHLRLCYLWICNRRLRNVRGGVLVEGVSCKYDSNCLPTDLSLSHSVYSSHRGIAISGVGLYDDLSDGTWVAPSLSHMRWDDPDYIKQAGDEIPVMKQRSDNDRHGFVIHDACWRVLQKSVEPNTIPLGRFFRICSSLTFPLRGIGVSWGHDYGGLSKIDTKDHYPWEDRLVDQYNESESYQYAKYNPYDVPEVFELLNMSSQEKQNYELCVTGTDCFSVLPWEIREAIAIILPTGDFLNLLWSSKSFLPLLTSQTFWASRFQTGNDRDFVFEARHKRPKDWITLYRMTSRAHSRPGLKNRRRIWGLIRAIVKVLYLQLDQSMECQPPIQNPEPRWTVAADVRGDEVSNYSFNEGCRLLQKQSTSIPADLVRIIFSTIGDGDIEYLAGMRFVSHNGTEIHLGYTINGKEDSLDITALRGFILAMGSRGIQGLQVVNSDGKVSKWFGCPKSSPVTERLVGTCPVAAVVIGLDVMPRTPQHHETR